jgi:hypothetical protein
MTQQSPRTRNGIRLAQKPFDGRRRQGSGRRCSGPSEAPCTS